MQDLQLTIELFENLGISIDPNSQKLSNPSYFRLVNGEKVFNKGEIHEEIILKPESIGVVIHFKCNSDAYKNDISNLSSEFKEDTKFILKKGDNQEKGLIFYEIPNNQNQDPSLERIMSYDLFVNYKRMHNIVKDYLAKL